jgi:hypothetical protein
MKEISSMDFLQHGEVFYFYGQALHNITPVSYCGRQRSLPSTYYDPYTHLSLLPLLSNSYSGFRILLTRSFHKRIIGEIYL